MRRVIPCRSCGKSACELELPSLEGVEGQILRQVLRFAAWKQGLTLPPDQCENPLEALDGTMIGELLAVVCADCVELRSRPSLLWRRPAVWSEESRLTW
jgi:hypothetical protein